MRLLELSIGIIQIMMEKVEQDVETQKLINSSDESKCTAADIAFEGLHDRHLYSNESNSVN